MAGFVIGRRLGGAQQKFTPSYLFKAQRRQLSANERSYGRRFSSAHPTHDTDGHMIALSSFSHGLNRGRG